MKRFQSKDAVNPRRTRIAVTGLLSALTAAVAFALIPHVTKSAEEATPVYANPKAPIEDRVADIVPRLTLEEKMGLIHGDESISDASTRPVPRLGIPRLLMSDGPFGVRAGMSTPMLTGVGLASTWNPPLIEKAAVVLGHETLAKGKNVLLGPCVNIHRWPLGGRNFESYSEDPFLAGRITVSFINGLQSTGVAASLKHFAMNNQETERGSISVVTDERTMQEIYLPQFKAAVLEANPWTIMCSYNKINGTHACENTHLLTDILKKDWGYKYVVLSDWGAVHSTIPTAMSGMDIEMPTGEYTGDALYKAVKEGKVPESVIDDKVARVLRVMFTSGLYDHKIVFDPKWVDSPESRAMALTVARESITLLKNDKNILPIDRKKVKTIAVIGPNADVARVGGGGSSQVDPFYAVSPLEGIMKQAGANIKISHAQGCDIQQGVEYEEISPAYFLPPDAPAKAEAATGDNKDNNGILMAASVASNSGANNGLKFEYYIDKDKKRPYRTSIVQNIDNDWRSNRPPSPVNNENFSVRYKGKLIPPVDGTYTFILINNQRASFSLDGKTVISNYAFFPTSAKTAEIRLKGGRAYDLKLDFETTGEYAKELKLKWIMPGHHPLQDAVDLAAKSDIAIVVLGTYNDLEREGYDREYMDLPGRQNELIEKISKANPHTIVVLANGSPLDLHSWIDRVPGVVDMWFGGTEGGRALGEVLFGDTNPSGKTTMTWPVKYSDTAPSRSPLDFPGKSGSVNYSEGIFVGYRYYDENKMKVLFPFGHGLSYTTFKYSDLKITPAAISKGKMKVQVSFNVTNTGKREGKEIAEVYVHDYVAGAPRPPRELKGFKKVALKPGEKQLVTVTLDESSFSFFDPKTNKWTAEPGKFQIQVGASSRDIRLSGDVTLK